MKGVGFFALILCFLFLNTETRGRDTFVSVTDPPGHPYFLSFFETSDNNSLEVTALKGFIKNYEILLKYFTKKQSRMPNEADFIYLVFNKVREAFLYNYQQYASFSDIITDNRYDCVTATALYASFLRDLNVDFDIWETNYHTYIKIITNSQQIMLETTDPRDGFVVGKEVHDRELKFKEDNLQGYLYEMGLNISKKTTPEQFTGLLYFNQAVKQYNGKNYLKALELIQNAEEYYSSERIELMKSIILDKVTLVSSTSP